MRLKVKIFDNPELDLSPKQIEDQINEWLKTFDCMDFRKIQVTSEAGTISNVLFLYGGSQ